MPESTYFEFIHPEPGADVLVHPHYKHGRYIHRDSRSLDYPVKVSEGGCKWWPWYKPKPKLVQAVQWTPSIPALNQGSLGSCTGNAAAHALATPSKLHHEIPIVNETLAVKIYSYASRIDQFQGAYPPNDTGSSGIAVCKVLKEYGYISRYEHANTLQQVKVALQDTPLLVGLNWRQDMYTPDSWGWVDYRGPIVGGHEVCLTGWEPEATSIPRSGYFTFRNSWGPSWGDNGDFYMMEDDLQKILNEQGDVIKPVWAA